MQAAAGEGRRIPFFPLWTKIANSFPSPLFPFFPHDWLAAAAAAVSLLKKKRKTFPLPVPVVLVVRRVESKGGREDEGRLNLPPPPPALSFPQPTPLKLCTTDFGIAEWSHIEKGGQFEKRNKFISQIGKNSKPSFLLFYEIMFVKPWQFYF